MHLKTCGDFLGLTSNLVEKHFLSQLEQGIADKVMRVNTHLCRDPQILYLLSALYKHSKHTLEHLFNTQITACFLSLKSGLDQLTTDYILTGALLHDVGKLLVPSHILSKPGSLSSAEWSIMKDHPPNSVKLLNSLGLPITVLTMIKYHHINYDGTGYPVLNNCPFEFCSLGNEFMLDSLLLLAMADAFDAMYHHRSYRPPFHVKQIHAEITTCISKQFAPWPANIMLNALSDRHPSIEEVIIC